MKANMQVLKQTNAVTDGDPNANSRTSQKADRPFHLHLFDKNVEDIIKNGYNNDVERAYNETVKKLEGYGIKCEKL